MQSFRVGKTPLKSLTEFDEAFIFANDYPTVENQRNKHHTTVAQSLLTSL